MGSAAAIDIGSNSILLTIAEPGASQAIPLRILFDECIVTGLSRGLSASGSITPESEARTAEGLKKFKEQLDRLKPSRLRVVGTEAFRRGSNGEEVRKRFSEILGQEVEIIGGEREAELSFWSVQKEHPQHGLNKIVFDIGGASTELCLGNRSGIQQRVSLKVGSVVLTETFALQASSKAELADLYVKKMLSEMSLKPLGPTLGIGVAGTITSLIAVDQQLQSYRRDIVHGFEISRDRILYHRDSILGMEPSDRRKIPGLQPDRADVFGGGLVIANAIAEHFGWQSITCLDSGVRFGVLYEELGL
jgi:exopolyphosphatase/guanosine-5'-triphosphate,3'-diphosphate pyrophosphatase